MANEKKMTKREKFEMIAKIKEVAENPVLAEFVEHELDLLAKKNASGSGKMTATQKDNEEIKEQILEEMANEPKRLFSISEMIKEFDCCKSFTLPKVTALVTALVKDGKVKRIEEKRKAYFQFV